MGKGYRQPVNSLKQVAKKMKDIFGLYQMKTLSQTCAETSDGEHQGSKTSTCQDVRMTKMIIQSRYKSSSAKTNVIKANCYLVQGASNY